MILRVINQRSKIKLPIDHFITISTLVILFSIDKKLLFFYIFYILITYWFNIVKVKRYRKELFFLFSILAILPFLLGKIGQYLFYTGYGLYYF